MSPEVTEGASEVLPAVTGEASLVLMLAADSLVVAGVWLAEPPPELALLPCVVRGTEAQGPAMVGRPD